MTQLRFVTLGPDNSNHAFVLQRYLQAHGIAGRAQCAWVDEFHAGARRILAGEADFLLQCAAHPAHAEMVGRYRRVLGIADVFASSSRPMALMSARCAPPAAADHVAVQPATQHYADLTGYGRVVFEPTVARVGEGLVAGRYAAGIGFAVLAQERPAEFDVQEHIAPVVDAWVVFAPLALCRDDLLVWPDSPLGRRLRSQG